MNEADCKRALDLYKEVAHIDRQIARLRACHTIDVKAGVWASVATGNYPIETTVSATSPFAPMMRKAIEGQLLHERNLSASELARLGCEIPGLEAEKAEVWELTLEEQEYLDKIARARDCAL
jgi:hypothetical protein